MNITAIKQQEQRKDRYSVFVDDKYAFSLGETALLEAQLTKGQEINERQLQEFKQLSADDKVYALALRYVVMRPRSIWEMREYLRRKQANDPTVEKILNKLTNVRLLDDEAFARAWVDNRRLLKATSRRRLELELRQKHVADDIIDAVLAEDKESTDEREVLRQLIVRKRSRYPDTQKLMAYLARQGYSYDDIKSVLDTTS